MPLNLDQEFELLKQEYLLSIEDDIIRVKQLVLGDSLGMDDFRETFRVIHSLKGGASSYEFTTISTICHYFEDFLSQRMSEDLNNKENLAICIRFFDILSEIIDLTKEGKEVVVQSYIDQISSLELGSSEQLQNFKGKVLVVDNTKTMGKVVKGVLKASGYDAIIAQNGLIAFNRLVTQKFDALITSINLNLLDGISLITALKSTDNMNANIPTLVISASKNIKERFPRDFKPEMIIVKDQDFIDNFKESFQSMLQENVDGKHKLSEGPKNILYVEDDPKMQKLMALSLRKYEGINLEVASSKKETLDKIKDFRPDVILLDNFLKDEKGIDVFNTLNKEKIPCIFLTASEAAVPVAEIGNSTEFLGIITKPFRPNAIYGQIRRFYNDRKNKN